MPIVNLPLLGLYESESPVIARVECSNWYVNIPQTSGAQTQSSLLGTPGIYQELTTGVGSGEINRGSHTKSNIPYLVNGQTLYRIIQTFDVDNLEVLTLESLGTVEGVGRVSMLDNGKQLMILVPGGKGYIYNEDDGTPFQEITAAGFRANGEPQYVVFVDSFFVVTTDDKKIIKSGSNDGLTWNSLEFATAEADPDEIVAPIVFKNQLYIAGTEIFEVFENRGTGGFPFQRVNGFIINKGVFAPASLVKNNDTFMFIGGGVNESPAIWALSGSSVVKISNTAIDSELESFSRDEIKQAFAWSYAQKGAYFVGFSLPSKTYVYDTISKQWHERTSNFMIGNFTQETRWRVNSLTSAYGRIFVGDSQDGRIGVVDVGQYQEYGNTIKRTFSTILISANGLSFSIPQIEVTVESGVGNELKADPQIRMKFTDDGKTWSQENWQAIGKVGRYNDRCIWTRQGRAERFRMYRFEMSDPVKPVIVKVEAKVKVGNRG